MYYYDLVWWSLFNRKALTHFQSSSCLRIQGGHLPFGKQLSWALWLNPGGHRTVAVWLAFQLIRPDRMHSLYPDVACLACLDGLPVDRYMVSLRLLHKHLSHRKRRCLATLAGLGFLALLL